MKTLVINTGSSSIKYQLIKMPSGLVICSGLIERIGEVKSRLTHKIIVDGDERKIVLDQAIPDHNSGMSLLADLLTDKKDGVIENVEDLQLVGHRIVHGGDKFQSTTRITKEVKEAILDLANLAPLHNPANLIGINTAEKVFPNATQVGVFDTAFHQSIPEYAFRYSLPEKYYTQDGIRAYGFHGTSHHYVSQRAAEFLAKKEEETSVITLHLGNGASISAVKNGKSIDTSLGMSTIGGLVMGTRIGDIDPGVLIYMQEILNVSWEELKNILNKESGLLGLCGENDLRSVSERYEAGDPKAIIALKIYAYRIKKYIGSYLAAIGKTDAIVFTAGVGENSSLIRDLVCRDMEHMGIAIDNELNLSRKQSERDISDDQARIKTLVIPTNEELQIAREAYSLVNQAL